MSKLIKKQNGFTLIEIMVSLGIFAIVVVVAAAALLKILDANKKAQSIQSAMTNLNYALESMSREIRVGTKYNCTNSTGDINYSGTSHDCNYTSTNSDQAAISFLSSEAAYSSTDNSVPCTNNLAYAYRFEKASDSTTANPKFNLLKGKQANHSSCGGPITGFDDIISTNNVTITGYRILVLAPPGNSNFQYPLAVIRVTGYAGTTERNKSYFDVQTAASARLP